MILTTAKTLRETLFDKPSHPIEGQTLRIGIFIDRAEGKAAALILSPENNRYAFLTMGEHAIPDPDNYDDVQDAMNAVCDDIQRWAKDRP
jgi:hypothetical protein